MSKPSSRVVLRAAVAGLCAVVVGVGGASFADAPSAWENSPAVSGFDFLLVLFLIPAGLALLITTLTVLPSLIKGSDGAMVVADEAPARDVTP